MATKFSSKDKNQITADWSNLFPSFSKYKPMQLIRKNGPVICGIHFKTFTSNDSYEVIFHVQTLLRKFPVISLSSAKFLSRENGAKESITLERHISSINSLAEKFKVQVSLIQKESIDIGTLLSYLKSSIQINPNAVDSRLDQIFILLWHKRFEEAEEIFKNYREESSQWSPVLKNLFNQQLIIIEETIRSRSLTLIQQIMKEQLSLFKLESFQDYEINTDQ